MGEAAVITGGLKVIFKVFAKQRVQRGLTCCLPLVALPCRTARWDHTAMLGVLREGEAGTGTVGCVSLHMLPHGAQMLF